MNDWVGIIDCRVDDSLENDFLTLNLWGKPVFEYPLEEVSKCDLDKVIVLANSDFIKKTVSNLYGNTVSIKYVDDDETEVYAICGSKEVDPFNNKISNESPIGKAIYGKKVGERVKVKVSDNYEYHITIRSVQKTMDDSQDKIRSF